VGATYFVVVPNRSPGGRNAGSSPETCRLPRPHTRIAHGRRRAVWLLEGSCSECVDPRFYGVMAGLSSNLPNVGFWQLGKHTKWSLRMLPQCLAWST